jgi:pentose-5-phosphate-3-epimerase
MDGHYVSKFTLGPDFCRPLVERTSIPLDIHLMIENPDAYIPVFAAFGNPALYIHPETSYHPLRSLQLIPTMIDKIVHLSRVIAEEGLEIKIEVDGNVSWQNIPRLVEAGAQILVAGRKNGA